MLYNPSWGRSELFRLDNFISWAKTKPADQVYDWGSTECPLATYCKEQIGADKLPPFGIEEVPWYYTVTANKPWNYGAMLTRAETLRAN